MRPLPLRLSSVAGARADSALHSDAAAGVRWSLAELYGGPDDSRLAADARAAHEWAERFAAKWRGTLGTGLGASELQRALRGLHVYLRGRERLVGKDCHLVLVHLDEAAGDREPLDVPVRIPLHTDLAGPQDAHEWRVQRQDADFTIDGRRDDHLDLVGVEDMLGSDDLTKKRACHLL